MVRGIYLILLSTALVGCSIAASSGQMGKSAHRRFVVLDRATEYEAGQYASVVSHK